MNPFANWTQADIDAQNRKASGQTIAMDDESAIHAQWEKSESELHETVLTYCKRMGWLVVHSRLDSPTTTALGVPDVIVAKDGGQTVWAELKRKGGKPTPQQKAFILALKIKGHRAGICYSMEEFLALIES